MSPRRNTHNIKVVRFFFLKLIQTNLHGGETPVVLVIYSLLITIAICPMILVYFYLRVCLKC